MSIWQHLRQEAAGAIRSVRYDLNRRTDDEPPTLEYGSQSRRAFIAVGMGVLVLGGAVGTYFAVVGGLNALMSGGSDGSSPPDGSPSVVTVPNGPASGSWAPPLEPIGGAPPQLVAGSPRPSAKPAPPVPTPRPTCRCTPPPTPKPTTPKPTTSTPSPTPTGTPAPEPTQTPTPAPPSDS